MITAVGARHVPNRYSSGLVWTVLPFLLAKNTADQSSSWLHCYAYPSIQPCQEAQGLVRTFEFSTRGDILRGEPRCPDFPFTPWQGKHQLHEI